MENGKKEDYRIIIIIIIIMTFIPRILASASNAPKSRLDFTDFSTAFLYFSA